ncbi:MAG: T9SS type A sorting domain-containing protein [Bacteroidetes bacterium]|nr:T9SS type A sorting domain-containing protein [Bacteroidota bacterium]
MKIFPALFFVTLSFQASAQLEASNWFFGIQAGITFSTNPPSALSGGQINQQEGCCSISDDEGNLLFYSDGQSVWDRNHDLMPNGTGLLGGVSSTQSSIVVQDPGNDMKYYLITAPQQATTNPLAYSIIDMSLNGGNGEVTSTKNVSLQENVTEKVTAVYHSNGTDVWVITHEFGNNEFDAFLITASGINTTPVVSAVGSVHDNSNNSNVIGYMKASPCGNQLAVALWSADYLELFDFDNATGTVSHPVTLGSWTASSGVYGVEFSPDDSRLYASIITPGYTIQWNLLAGDDAAIIASADTIGTSPVGFNGALQTGPDARIYLVKFGSNTLDCITNPNGLGSACNYVQDFISLGAGFGQLGLPDFFSSYFCNIEGVQDVNVQQPANIFPNPAQDAVTISLSNEWYGKEVMLRIFNALGQEVYNSQLNAGAIPQVSLPVNNWSKGVYFLNIAATGKAYSEKFMKL